MPTALLEVLSRHVTSEGVVTYARTGSGGLTVWLEPRPGSVLLVASEATVAPTDSIQRGP